MQQPDTRLWSTPEEYLAASPLTQKECEKGCALRIVHARWAGLGESIRMVSWTVLHLSRRKPAQRSPRIRLEGASVVFSSKMTQFSLPYRAVTVCTEEDTAEEWHLGEAEVVLPVEAKWFSLSCDGAIAVMPFLLRRRMLYAHFAEIANAAADHEGYEEWFLQHRHAYHLEPCSEGPLMSIIVPAYKTPPAFLREVIDTIQAQLYENWELVIVNASPGDEAMADVLSSYDDKRIVVVDCPENDGIVGNTNVGIAASHGDYLSFLDHDDFVEPEALLFYVHAILDAQKQGKIVDLLYCDEDSFNDEQHFGDPFFKPDFNLDLLLSNNYMCHWLTVNRRVVESLGTSRKDVEGAQDFDMNLRAVLCGGEVVHIPHVMYHWRVHPGSVNANPDAKLYAIQAGQNAVKHYLDARGLPSSVTPEPCSFTYRATYQPATWPSIDCFVEQGPISPALASAAQKYRDKGGTIEIKELPEDTPSARNAAIKASSADAIAFMPNDIAKVGNDFFPVLAGYLSRQEVAAVSPRVIRPDGLNDYAGIAIAPDGKLLKLNYLLPRKDGGYLGRAERPYDTSVLYASAVLFRRADVAAAGLFGENYETSCYATADICLQMRASGKLCVYSPFAEAWRSDFTSQFGSCLAEDAKDDCELFVARHGAIFAQGDPSHNPNFDPESLYYQIRHDRV